MKFSHTPLFLDFMPIMPKRRRIFPMECPGVPAGMGKEP